MHSCESASCGRCDVPSCCSSGTYNIWCEDSSIIHSKNLVKHHFAMPVWCLVSPPFSSRCPAGCSRPAAAGDRGPAGCHLGKVAIWICVCSFASVGGGVFLCFMSSLFSFFFFYSCSADDYAGNGNGQQPCF